MRMERQKLGARDLAVNKFSIVLFLFLLLYSLYTTVYDSNGLPNQPVSYKQPVARFRQHLRRISTFHCEISGS